MLKIYTNKHGNVDKFELPTGDIEKRYYGNLPNMLLLEPYEEEHFEMYNHKNEIQFEAILLEVKGRNTIVYDIVKRYVDAEEE